ncbi:MAG TPA: hypothetical protein VMS11_11955 [Solirubrobacterales bacterium]|nr:hypothetical protein [Solirubrobacterales bacterium]
MSGGFTRSKALAGLALCAAALALGPQVGFAAAAGPEGGLDGRGWELVSPLDKNGGEVAPPTPGGGVTQAAVSGGAIGFGSESSFAEGEGAAPVSQYLAGRGVDGWGVQNLTPPLLSGTYAGGAYQAFSADLSRTLLSSGWRCRDGGSECEAENPPLASGAPAGYRNLYLRQGSGYQPLITSANAPALSITPAAFHLALAGASPDLRHTVISSCAALTANAVEVAGPAGCDPSSLNLYEWEEGSLAAVNILPGQSESAPGAGLAAPSGAISTDGHRVYWSNGANLYLREGSLTKQVDETVGGGGAFQAASADGSVAYFTKAQHLYRFATATGATLDLTPGGEVQGVLGASADGSYLYYLTAAGLFAYNGGASVKAAATADASNYPPATGTARVSADGTRLAFLSSASLTGYANVGKAEAFVYDASAARLLCASCNPRGATPAGPSTIPGALAAGGGPLSYKPRALTADGTRLFFDSGDALVFQDTDKAPDVYEWQAQGAGGCAKAAGCIGLISGGRTGSASFVDASADGTDAFFLTAASLLPVDAEGIDIYDARAGGGFPEPQPPIPCNGDDCQGPAPGPDDPTPTTALFQGPANPKLHFPETHQKKPKKHSHKKRGRGKKKGHRTGARHHRGGGR